MSNPLRQTVLHSFHVSRKARMGPFAGYDMPIHYPLGAVKEHLHTRQAAGLFDVSHVGFFEFRGADRERFFEWVTPSSIQSLCEGRMALTIFLNEAGGVKDDCIVCKCFDCLLCIVNAGCKEKDAAHLRAQLKEFNGNVELIELNRAMVSLQGPRAAAVFAPYVEDLEKLTFMGCRRNVTIKGMSIDVLRCSYSGEDGFDIIMRPQDAGPLVEHLLQHPDVQMAGLGARDTLRLEAGLNLYGHEIAEDINPIAARFMWSISKRRMAEAGFIGHAALQTLAAHAVELVPRVRVGIVAATGPVPRANMPIFVDGQEVGKVSSGCPSPVLACNIALGFVDRRSAAVGQQVEVDVRGKRVPGTIVNARFVKSRYHIV